jgi:membrane fusion protein, multidrug efflux system
MSWGRMDVRAGRWKLAAGAATVAAIVAVGWYFIASSEPSTGAPAPAAIEPPAIPVMVAAVRTDDIPILLSGLGTVSAFNTAMIRSQVDGKVERILFREGQDVKIGEVLVELDRRPFQAVLDQMQANIARDRAQLENARLDFDRISKLLVNDFASKQRMDTQRMLVAQFQAAVASDAAQLESARIQLEYATIRSPIDGRTSIRQVDVGNLVRAADSVSIVSVTQVEPISVVFTLSADELPQIVDAHAQGGATLAVTAFAKDNRQKLAEGTLLAIDNVIDQSTGTIKLKAEFPNKDRKLWPGQFVNASLHVRTDRAVVTLPASAVLRGPEGSYVFVIRADSTAAYRRVTAEVLQGNRAIIRNGLRAGERVVVEGQYRLRNGVRVTILEPRRPSAALPGISPADPA